jgi:hypothetical protein
LSDRGRHRPTHYDRLARRAQGRAERLRSGHAEHEHDLYHLANLVEAALDPDDVPAELEESFPPALRALLRSEVVQR